MRKNNGKKLRWKGRGNLERKKKERNAIYSLIWQPILILLQSDLI
jgi:hypothetical protein